jgi:hypothetical protein
MIEITDHYMTLTVEDKVIATARYSQHAAADGFGAWIVSWCANRLFKRGQAITALTIAELRAIGRSDDDPIVAALLGELCL